MSRKENTFKTGRRLTGLAMVVVIVLALTKAIVGFVSGAVVLVADAVHSISDFFVLLASWFGFKIAGRARTKRFPYGFYKAETLAAMFISLMILSAGIMLFTEGVKELFTTCPLRHTSLALFVSALAVIVSLVLSIWEKWVGKRINAHSLIATAEHTLMDAATSLLVFISIILIKLGVPYIEGVLTILISAVILWVGVKNGRIAIYGLMDATPSPELENTIAQVANAVEGVKGIGAVAVRQAGPFYFGELHLKIAGNTHVSTAHSISHEVEQAVRRQIPQVEALTVHIEPSVKSEEKKK